MIIDSHVYVMSPNFIAEPYRDNWVRLFSSLSNRPEYSMRERLPESWDETGALLLKDVHGAGIRQNWISVLNCSLAKTVSEGRYLLR